MSLASSYNKNGCENILVDWDCPQKSGEWTKTTYPETKVIQVPDKKYFHRTKPKNIGASEAVGEFLCFKDADVIIKPSFFTEVLPNINNDRFYVRIPTEKCGPYVSSISHWQYNGKPDIDRFDLVGFLIVPKYMFDTIGGYDESFDTYGHEDIDIRLNLILNGKYKEEIIGPGHLIGIRHGTFLREQFQSISKSESCMSNFKKLDSKWGSKVDSIYSVRNKPL